MQADRVILATGGRALPKVDPMGLGTPLQSPSAIRRVIASSPPRPARSSGATPFEKSPGSLPASLTVVARSGKHLAHTEGDLLLTHFGISGPVALDIATLGRDAFEDDHDVRVLANLHPKQTIEETDASLRDAGAKTIQSWLRELFLDRLAAAVLDLSGTSGQTARAQLTKRSGWPSEQPSTGPLRFEGDRDGTMPKSPWAVSRC